MRSHGNSNLPPIRIENLATMKQVLPEMLTLSQKQNRSMLAYVLALAIVEVDAILEAEGNGHDQA